MPTHHETAGTQWKMALLSNRTVEIKQPVNEAWFIHGTNSGFEFLGVPPDDTSHDHTSPNSFRSMGSSVGCGRASPEIFNRYRHAPRAAYIQCSVMKINEM